MQYRRKAGIGRMRNRKGIWLIFFGIVIMAVPFFMRMQERQRTGEYIRVFEEESNRDRETDDNADDPLWKNGEVIGIIRVESLDLEYPVFEGARNEQLNNGIGHLTETAALCGHGNCVLAGHNGSRRGVFFTHLAEIEQGAEVELTNKNHVTHSYIVTETKVVNPYSESVRKQTEQEILTLFTCANHGTQRFVVTCGLKGGDAEVNNNVTR